MAREPQRSVQPRPLGASLVPLERALRARAHAIDGLKDELPVGTAQRLFVVGIAAEFRALADELRHW